MTSSLSHETHARACASSGVSPPQRPDFHGRLTDHDRVFANAMAARHPRLRELWEADDIALVAVSWAPSLEATAARLRASRSPAIREAILRRVRQEKGAHVYAELAGVGA